MATRTQFGAQPFVSAYVTVNVKVVAVVPIGGAACPALSCGLCDWLEQPAAQAEAGASRVAMSANESAKRRAMVRALPGRVGSTKLTRYAGAGVAAMHQKYA